MEEIVYLNEVEKVVTVGSGDYIIMNTADGKTVQIRKADLLSDIYLGDDEMKAYPCIFLGSSTFHSGPKDAKMILFCPASSSGGTSGRLYTSGNRGYSIRAACADIYIGCSIYAGNDVSVRRKGESIKVGTCVYNGVNHYCAYIVGSAMDFKGQNLYFTGASTYLASVAYTACTDFKEIASYD